MRWYQDHFNRKRIVRIPKLDKKQKNKVLPGIEALFEHELINIIKTYITREVDEIDDDTKWKVFNGALEECLHRIRRFIYGKLHLNYNNMYKSIRNTRIPISRTDHNASNQGINRPRIIKFKMGLNRYYDILDDSSVSETLKQKAELRILKFLELFSQEEKVRIWNHRLNEDMLKEIVNNKENLTYTEWLDKEIMNNMSVNKSTNKSNIAIER